MTTVQTATVSVPPVGAAQARVAAVACLALLVPLPVPWPVTDTPFGAIRWVHIGIVVLLLCYGVGVGRLHGLFGRCAPLLVVLGAMTTLAVVSAVSYGAAWADPVQKYLYALVAVAFGAAAFTALCDDAGRRILAWAGPAATVWTVAGMVPAVRAADIDPLTRLGAALAAGEPGPIANVVTVGLRVEAADGTLNGRHESVAALLVALLVTAVAVRACRRWERAVVGVLCAVGWVVVLGALSRAVLLAVLVPVVAAAVRALRWSPRRRMILAATTVALAGGAVAAWPLVRLLYARTVTDTGSYSERLGAWDIGSAELGRRVLSGGPPLATSTHSLPGDMLLLGGWLAGLCALTVVAVLAGMVVVTARRHHADGSLEQLVALSVATLVLVRSLTTGGGYLDLAEWAAVGLVLALGLTARRAAAD